MQTKPVIITGYIACFIGIGATLWISSVNLVEIVNRAGGQYTFYSQRASLTDDEAVVYFSAWTLLVVFLCYLSVKSLIGKKYIRSIVYALAIVLAIFLSVYVDTLFYYKLP